MPRLHLPLTTERLTVRGLVSDDVDDVAAYRSLIEVGDMLPCGPLDRQQVADWVTDSATVGLVDHAHGTLTLGVDLHGRIIGDLLLRMDGVDGPDGKQYEVGWAFNPQFGRQGYATEAARALIDVAFRQLGAHRVWARLDPTNTRSAGVCERLRMRREAHFRGASWWHGAWGDLVIYAIRRDEWGLSVS